ncbi:MAG: hypothetical protein AM325_006800 [Candidatus Thorarchaeota archaeon SMTZ1-45]|nr:MAG: hypothetical protein AM325_08550 [Candidatus Thorarchaeota archaeon SMTZ1-45]
MSAATEKFDRVLVRSDFLARCKWCGTPHSPDWVKSEYGDLYCSRECQSAAGAGWRRQGGALGTLIGAVLLLLPNPASILIGLNLLPVSLCILIQGVLGRRYVNRKDRYRNAELLVCEYCNHINTPGVVVCDNCGATLTGADFSSDSWPEWFVLPPKVNSSRRRKYGTCGNCGRPFNYPALSADGKDRCPKCGSLV